jgi:hypothetical protein
MKNQKNDNKNPDLKDLEILTEEANLIFDGAEKKENE